MRGSGTTSRAFRQEKHSQGDTELGELHRRYGAPLRAYFSKRLRGSGDPDDLVQEVFVRLARRGGFGNIQQLEGYIFQTAANILRDWARRRSARRADDHVPFVDELYGNDCSSPERIYLGKEAARQLVAALQELPPRTRAVFVLRRLEAYRYAEIARHLEISVSSAEKHMAKALAHLAERSGRI